MKITLKNVVLEFQGKELVEEELTTYTDVSKYPTTQSGDGVTPALYSYGSLHSKRFDIEGMTGQLKLKTNKSASDVAIAVMTRSDGETCIPPVIGWNTRDNGLEATINLDTWTGYSIKYLYLLNDTSLLDTSSCIHIYYR